LNNFVDDNQNFNCQIFFVTYNVLFFKVEKIFLFISVLAKKF